MSDLELVVLSGARTGTTLRAEGDQVTVGRSAEATLRFDPVRDLEVSALHAVLERRAGGWFIRDLDSRNGTWVDGAPVQAEHPLREGSHIRFGAGGPEVRVRLVSARVSRAGVEGRGAPRTVSSGALRDPSTPSDRIRTLSRRNRALTRALVGGLLLVTGGMATVAYAWIRRDADFERERAALGARMDSLLVEGQRTIADLQGEMDGLAEVLRRSNEEVRQLRAAVDAAGDAGADRGELEALRLRLQAATVALTRQQLAASLDFGSIEAANRAAVAVVYVELRPGVVFTATAFAVRSDGTLLTNRHAVRPREEDVLPTRIGVQFSGSPQVWPARVLTVAPEADLALLKVSNVTGEVPTIAGFNESVDTLAAGTPVALLGFPLGGDPGPPVGGRALPRPLLTAGILQGRNDGFLEIVGYGEEGASGSPVLDGEGRVVGVLFGGRDDGTQRTLLAVSVTEVLRFLGRPPG